MRKLLLALTLVASTGCYRTVIRSGLPPAPAPAIEVDDKWHHGLVWGIAELSGPYDLAKICPQGWAEIHTRTSFLNGIVDGVTRGIYAPQTITVICAAGRPEGPPPAIAPPPTP